jgi:LysM repeat protein
MQRSVTQGVTKIRDAWRIRRNPARRRRAAGLVAGAAMSLCMLLGGPAAAQAESIHVIRAGDSLAAIARQYEIDPDLLATYNDISDPNLIVIGQQIAIPPQTSSLDLAVPVTDSPLPGAKGYHTVTAGESLTQIGRRYDIALSDLLRLNGLANPNTIWVGQKLRLSARVDPAAHPQAAKPDLADAIHVVAEDETLSLIAKQYGTTIEQLMRVNGLPNSGFVYTGQRLRVQAPPPAQNIFGVAGAPADGHRRIEVDLSDQSLIAWQGEVAVLRTTVSTGKPATPTIPGTFAVHSKYDTQHMTGDDYDLPGVPWVMYYYEDYAIHGAYWHANFGWPTSHGCINMRIDEAAALYAWAALGTEVVVHE